MLTDVQRLKIQLYVHGMIVSPTARQELQGETGRPLTMADYASTTGIALKLEEDVWVNAPFSDFNANFVGECCPYTFDFSESSGFSVRGDKIEVAAEPVRVAGYSTDNSRSGTPFSSLAITHSDRVRISPVQGCAIECEFCDFPYRSEYQAQRKDDLIESLERAVSDEINPAKHILISGGTPRKKDYDYLNDVYSAVLARFPDLDIDIMMAPMPGLLEPKKLKELGVNALSINLELFNQELANKIMKSKYKLSRQRYFDFIESAVDVFGVSKVRSLLMVGIEPLEDTLRAVQALAERGCEPLLSAFRPDPYTPMANHPLPSADFLEQAYLRSREIVEKYQVRLGPRCIACQHNVLTFPDGSDYYFYY